MVVALAGVLQTAPADPGHRFRDLARQQLPRLLSIARRMVGDDAEDAVQDCLLKAFQRFDQLHDPAAARAWLTRILVNCCRDRGRASARRPNEIDFEASRSSRCTARSPPRIRSRIRTPCTWTSSPSSGQRTYGRCC